jgi:dUTP pyrophosphatase
MQVKFKILNYAAVLPSLPSYAKECDAGLDLTCISEEYDVETGLITYRTGIAVEIPEGYVGLIFPRSSIRKTSLMLSNSVGVIDSGYRGEIIFSFREVDELGDNNYNKKYHVGDRIGQLVIIPYPKIEPIFVTELSKTDRGTNGFGSTGN